MTGENRSGGLFYCLYLQKEVLVTGVQEEDTALTLEGVKCLLNMQACHVLRKTLENGIGSS